MHPGGVFFLWRFQMKYDRFVYLRPPRCDARFSPLLSEFERYRRRGWLAQAKMNGFNSVIFVPPTMCGRSACDRIGIQAWNRHNKVHSKWHFTRENSQVFRNLPLGWWVFNAELLASKDVHFVHDVLVAEGRYLVGESFANRQNILWDVFAQSKFFDGTTDDHWVVDKHVWLARNIPNPAEAWAMAQNPKRPEIEGIVVKDPLAVLSLNDLTSNGRNAPWMAKCRKATKNVRS